MTLRSFVSMIVLTGVFTLPASALVADAGERAASQERDTRTAGGQLGVCCQQDDCVPTVNDEDLCVEEFGGTWHPRADCTVCGCSKLALAGIDCWHTECGATEYDFANEPLPADFFGPGSQPFDGVVKLGSSPSSPGPDTQIRRLADMCFDGGLPVSAQTPIQLIELSLVSCVPILVTFDTGNTSQWNVTVALDDFGDEVPQPEGLLFAKKTDDGGGTFDSLLPVRPKFSFTNNATGQTLETDSGQIPDTTLEALGVRWWQFQPPFGTCSQGGFSPGEFDPDNQCCPETCHSSFGTAPHEHCVIPPECEPCPVVQTGACCNGNDGSCAENSLREDCEGDQLTWTKGTACDEANCVEHTGACCDGTNGVCENNVLRSDCAGFQESWFKGLPCDAIDCVEHTGACCDGTNGVCTDGVRQGNCAGEQQTWFKNTLCDDGTDGIPFCVEHTGACCDGTDGSCTDDVRQGNCQGDQQSWFKELACDAIDCVEHTGACCDGTNGSCTNGVRQGNCLGDQQSWFKQTSCGTFECVEHTGGCCDATTGICTNDVRQGNCLGNQQTWFKQTSCDTIDCVEPTGACCNDRTGACASDVPASQCSTTPNDAFGPWRWTQGRTCDELTPPCGPRGACCIDGDCLGVLNINACQEEGGSFFEGQACDVCLTPPSEPCENCGLTEHWVDDPACPAGVDRLNLSGAKFGLDFDVDTDECLADASVRAHGPTWINFSGPVDDSTWFPGTRNQDNHLDVRDTEIVSMELVSVDGRVRMTAGFGLGAIPLPHTYGAIAELAGDKALAESFFHVLVEIEVLDAADNVIVRLYNREPVLVETIIDCIPPDANYIHPTGCIPLWTSPIVGEGVHIANLVSAEHRTFEQRGACCDGTTGDCVDDQFEAECPVNPGDPANQFTWHKEQQCADIVCREHTGACCDRRTQTCTDNVPESQCQSPNEPDRFEWTKDTPCDQLDPPCEPRGACCLDGRCLGVLSAEACHAEGGSWFEGRECDVCSTEPSEPCENCGLTEHWVDDPACPGGVDRLELSGAKFGLDFDIQSKECLADVSVRAHGPTWINFSGPQDDSNRFPGLRDQDGHLDVRDTEIVSMDLVSPNGLVRMTAGWGRGAIPLPHTYGAIAELPGDKALAESFFEAFVEIEVLDAANNVLARLYNREPVRVEATIDCIPPDANYIHPVGCIPLFTSPIPGEGVHIANLVSAEHRTFEAACFETIGGAVYTDCDSPLTSGEENVAITVGGPGGVFNAVTSGPSGVWSIENVPCGEYTVAAVQVFREYCHVDIGGDCPPEPCVDSTVINVDPVNRAENLSIQFLGREDCIRNDMNYDESCTIVFDVDLFVQCVYDGDCVGPEGRDLKCPADCNCDDLTTIVFDADCFVHHVFVKGECGSCDDPVAKSRVQDGRRAGFTIGGAVYDDASNPLFSGVQGVTVQIFGQERKVVARAATAGPSGIWRVDDLPEGDYTVVIERRNGRVAAGRDVIRITVNAENEAANLSIAVLRDSGPTRPRDGRRDRGQRSE